MQSGLVHGHAHLLGKSHTIISPGFVKISPDGYFVCNLGLIALVNVITALIVGDNMLLIANHKRCQVDSTLQ